MVPEHKVIPMNGRILLLKDDDRDKTRGGIFLPDESKTPVITGCIVGMPTKLVQQEGFEELVIGDKVIVDPKGCVPVDFEIGNKQWLIPATNILAILKRTRVPQEVTSD